MILAFTMLKLFILLALVANLNFVLTVTPVLDTTEKISVNDTSRPKCNRNEVPSDCANSPCIRNCATKDLNLQCKPYPPGCKRGCVCVDGYLRDNNEFCVPIDKCPSNNSTQCGTNEVPSECANNPCQPTCERPDQDTYCKWDPANCKPGCVCAKGFLRDSTGNCIPEDKCRKPQCKENEEYSTCPNKNCREKTCNQIGFGLIDCPLDGDNSDCGKPECICKDGLVRNETGDCVDKRECPSCGGDPNAWSGCGVYCERCTKKRPCPRICLVNSCDCRPGYLYSEAIKKCVKPDQCPPQCGTNEVPSDCATNPCLPNCAQPELDTYCRPNPANCKPGCVCADGYVRNDTNVCVRKDQCPLKCKENEEPSDCPNKVCLPKTCDELGFPLPCFENDYNNTKCDKPACICKSPLVRNKDGMCVNKTECPSCRGDPNAMTGCGSFCINCDNYNNKPRICPFGCILNGCQCRDGFIYDKISKKCVRPEQCTRRCGINEIHSDCATNPCLPTCEQPELDTYCRPNPAICKPGCVCAEGYVRNDKKVCVRKDQCPKKCGPLEVYSSCANAGCDKRNCSQVAQPALCIDVSEGGCIGGCVCKSDYLLTSAGNCVPVSECPPGEICPLPHEYYDTCPTCPPRECRIDERLVLCAPTDGCEKPKCVCEKGFYRNDEGFCVTRDKCPPICGENEVPSDCATNICLPTCDEPKRNLYCKPNPANCKPGCVCAEGYLRDKNGFCVPRLKCQRDETKELS